MIVEGGSASWNACSIGYTRLKREFQLGVNGRYEISGGLKRNALSTAIQITRIGLADISGLLFSPFFKKKKESFSNAPSTPRSARSHPYRAISKGPILPIPATYAPVSKALRTHARTHAREYESFRRAELILEFSIDTGKILFSKFRTDTRSKEKMAAKLSRYIQDNSSSF